MPDRWDILDGIAGLLKALLPAATLVMPGIVIVWFSPLVDRYVTAIGPWDEQGLRRGLLILAVLAFLGGLGLLVPKHLRDLLPSGAVWAAAISALMALTLLQYTTLGGGQPLWAIEHVIVHVLDLLGFERADIQELTGLLHRHVAATRAVTWAGDVESRRFVIANTGLVVIAFATVTWATSAARVVSEPAWKAVTTTLDRPSPLTPHGEGQP